MERMQRAGPEGEDPGEPQNAPDRALARCCMVSRKCAFQQRIRRGCATGVMLRWIPWGAFRGCSVRVRMRVYAGVMGLMENTMRIEATRGWLQPVRTRDPGGGFADGPNAGQRTQPVVSAEGLGGGLATEWFSGSLHESASPSGGTESITRRPGRRRARGRRRGPRASRPASGHARWSVTRWTGQKHFEKCGWAVPRTRGGDPWKVTPS